MDQVKDLVLAPFYDMVEKGKTAVLNAGENAEMIKAGQSLVKEGERALKRIEPQCQRHYNEFGPNFLDALKEHDEIAEYRKELINLLWEFDDFIEFDDFDPEKYTELQQVSRKAAPHLYDILMRMRLCPPVTGAMSICSGSSGDAGSMSPRPESLTLDSLDFNFPLSEAQGLHSQQLAMYQSQQQSPTPSAIQDFESLGIHQLRPQPGNILVRSSSTIPPPQLSPPSSIPFPPRPPSINPWDPNIKPGSHHGTNDILPLPMPPRSYTVDSNFNIHSSAHEKVFSPLRTLSFADSQHNNHSPNLEMSNPFSTSDFGSSSVRIQSDLPSPPGMGQSDSVSGNPRSQTRALSTSSSLVPPLKDLPILGVATPVPATSGSSMRISVPPSIIPEHGTFSPDFSTTSFSHRNSTASMNKLSHQQSLESMQGSNQSDHQRSRFSSADSHTGTVATSVSLSPTGGSHGSRTLQIKDIPNSVPEEVSSLGHVLQSDDGLIVVAIEDADNNKDLTPDQSNQVIPTSSVVPTLKPALIGPHSSFNLYKGFCKGAYEVLNGDIGVTLVRKQTFNGSHTVGRCTHCMFELDYKELEYDLNNDDRGNFTLVDTGFRIRFLQKSHVATRRNDEQFYACMICVNLGQTVEESDATIFFTQKDLFHHLSQHPRPLPPIDGLTIVQTPEVPPELKNNYDLHIKSPQTISLTSLKAGDIAKMPVGICKETIKKLYGMRMLNNHTPAFEMAEGARVVGIEFVEKYEGEWCMGFHNGAYASFPFDAIRLEHPIVEALRRNSGSTVRAVARWKFAPKYKKEYKGDWLKFDKGEVITNIIWISRDHWCWSGITSKGKWGIFLSSHVDMKTMVEGPNNSDEASLASSGKTAKTEGGSFLGKFKNKEKAPPLPGLL